MDFWQETCQTCQTRQTCQTTPDGETFADVTAARGSRKINNCPGSANFFKDFRPKAYPPTSGHGLKSRDPLGQQASEGGALLFPYCRYGVPLAAISCP